MDEVRCVVSLRSAYSHRAAGVVIYIFHSIQAPASPPVVAPELTPAPAEESEPTLAPVQVGGNGWCVRLLGSACLFWISQFLILWLARTNRHVRTFVG